MKRKLGVLLLSFCICLPAFSVWAETADPAQPEVWREFFVSAQGNDESDGSQTAPFRTLTRAQQAVRECNEQMQGDIVVQIASGRYELDDTLRFKPEDSGKNGHRVIWQGEDMPVVSGGTQLTGFAKSGYDGIWQLKVENPDIAFIRELYVNERLAYMASSDKSYTFSEFYKDDDPTYEYDGLYLNKSDIGRYQNPEEIEFQWYYHWKYVTTKVEEIFPDPENSDRMIVRMEDSWWNLEAGQASDGSFGPKPERPFIMANAFELLDAPGEFYFDKKTRMLYYMPREGEDLETATVIAPKLEKLMILEGSDVDEKVENISFRGIKFAHTAFAAPDSAGVRNNQANSWGYTNGMTYKEPASIEMNYFNSVNFYDNYFFGSGSGGISFRDGGENFEIIGNAFSDLADAALISGWNNQTDQAMPSGTGPRPAPGEWNLNDENVKVYTSYYGTDNSHTLANLLTNQNTVANDSYASMSGASTWMSDPKAAEKAEKQWVFYDLEDYFTLSKIRLGFNTEEITDKKMRTGFEVLVSNNRNFPEEETVLLEGTSDSGVTCTEFTPPQDRRFRYVLIRAKEAKQVAISGVWLMTPDVEPHALGQKNKGATITNNFMTRCGIRFFSGGAISFQYIEDFNISHNEISDIPYSGIMFGWGWSSNATGTRNNIVAQNYIHNVTQIIEDGGGIYTMSDLGGTIVEENYIDGLVTGYAALYTDQGSAHGIFRNNVTIDSYFNYMAAVAGIRDNEVTGIYSTSKLSQNKGTNNTMEEATVFLPGNPPPAAYKIMRNAGLEPEYQHIRDWVGENSVNIPDTRTILTVSKTESGGISAAKIVLDRQTAILENVLANGAFGSLPGEYPYAEKFAAQKYLEQVNAAATTEQQTEAATRAREYTNSLKPVRFGMDELLTLGEEALAKANASGGALGGAPDSAVSVFAKKLADVRGSLTGDEGNDYSLLLELEEAYRTFENSRYMAEIADVYAEDALRTTVHAETREVVVTVPAGTLAKARALHILPYGSSVIADAPEAASLAEPVTVSLFCRELNRYQTWTIRGIEEGTQSGDIGTENWIAVPCAEDSMARSGNALYLKPRAAAYLNTAGCALGEEQSILFQPMTRGATESYGIVFGVSNAETFDRFDTAASNTYFLLETDGSTDSLYAVSGTEKTLLKSYQTRLSAQKINRLSVKLTPSGLGTRICVWVNGALAADVLSGLAVNGSYMGIITTELTIRVYKQTAISLSADAVAVEGIHEPGVLILSSYNGEGILKSVSTYEVQQDCTVAFTDTSLALEADGALSAMLWSKLDAVRPMTKAQRIEMRM